MANGATFSMMPFVETEQGTLSLLLKERVQGKNNALSPADNVATLQHNFILSLHAAHFSTRLHALPCLLAPFTIPTNNFVNLVMLQIETTKSYCLKGNPPFLFVPQ